MHTVSLSARILNLRVRIRERCVFCAWLIFAALGGVLPAQADYIPFNGAEVAPNVAEMRIGTAGISIQLEVFIEDIPVFEALLPDGWFRENMAGRPDEATRLKDFSETGLSVRREDGRALPVEILTVEPRLRIDRTTALSGQVDPLTGRTFPKPPDDPRVMFVELFYDFENERPSRLTFAPPLRRDEIPSATIGKITFDRDVPVTNFRYLSEPITLTVDWNDPWYTRFDNPNLARHHQSGVTTFIYVDPRQVRHETLIRARDLAPWLSLEMQSGDVIGPDAQTALKDSAIELLSGRNPVRIDGHAAVADDFRAEVITLEPSGLQILEEGPVGADAAFIGVSSIFPVRDLPQQVEVTWDMFNDQISNVPATATDPVGPFMSGATPDNPIISWNNHLLTYQNPSVKEVQTKQSGALPVSLISLSGLLLAVVAGIVGWRNKGYVRSGANVCALLALVGAFVLRNEAQVDLHNGFSRVPSNVSAAAVFEDILTGIASAHVEISPEKRRTSLAPIVTNTSMEDVTQELERALTIRVPGGGLALVNRINGISLANLAPLEQGFGFQALAEWSVQANAGHWGHDHRRAVKYRALVEVKDDNGSWKLDGITVLEAKLPEV